VALSDYPPLPVKWETGLTGEMLSALGNLAVISAQAEELLHQIYWHHAGLNEQSGPIVTDNLNPKRLEEDIVKFVSLDKAKTNILADLKILFLEFETLNTKRNHCLHWIWQASEKEGTTGVTLGSTEPISYHLNRPIYRQKGESSRAFTVEDVRAYCKEFSWLQYRLRSHTFGDEQLRQKRRELDGKPPLDGMAIADLFWPAPWLDKPLPPETMPPNHHEKRK
jgi:hypothetical protein